MHLIALERELTSRRGGQELNLFEICRGLAHRGYRIQLLYVKEGDLLEPYRRFCDRVIKINSYGFDWRSLSNTLNFVPSLAQLWQVPVTNDSLIFCNDYHFALFGYALSYARNLPYVCYLQIPPCDFNRQRRFGLSRVNQFIAVSHQTKREWAECGYPPEKIDVVHNGTDLSRFDRVENWRSLRQQWGVSEETKLISYVGRIDTEKGLESLIQATSILIHQGTKVQVLLAGKPVVHYSSEKGTECEEEGMKYQRSLMQFAEQLGVGHCVKFLGHLSDPASLYQASDISVLPSVWNEPFGRSIIESLACGIPVIASRIGGIPEILTGEFESYLSHPGNAQDLANHLSKVMDWREKDPDLGRRCRDHVLNRFTYEKMVDGVEQVLLKTGSHQIYRKDVMISGRA